MIQCNRQGNLGLFLIYVQQTCSWSDQWEYSLQTEIQHQHIHIVIFIYLFPQLLQETKCGQTQQNADMTTSSVNFLSSYPEIIHINEYKLHLYKNHCKLSLCNALNLYKIQTVSVPGDHSQVTFQNTASRKRLNAFENRGRHDHDMTLVFDITQYHIKKHLLAHHHWAGKWCTAIFGFHRCMSLC